MIAAGGGGNNRTVDILINFKPGSDFSAFEAAKRQTSDLNALTTNGAREASRSWREAQDQHSQAIRHLNAANSQFVASLTGAAQGIGNLARGSALLFGSTSQDLEKFIRLFAGVEGGIQVMTGLIKTVREGERAWRSYNAAMAAGNALLDSMEVGGGVASAASGAGGAAAGSSGVGAALVIPLAALAAAALSTAAALKVLTEVASGNTGSGSLTGRIASGEAGAAQWAMRNLGAGTGTAGISGGLGLAGGALFGLPGMAVGGFTGYKLAGEAGAANSAEDRAARQQGFRDAAHAQQQRANESWSVDFKGQTNLEDITRRRAAFEESVGLKGSARGLAQTNASIAATDNQLAGVRSAIDGVKATPGGADMNVQLSALLEREKELLTLRASLGADQIEKTKQANAESLAIEKQKLAINEEQLSTIKQQLEAQEGKYKSVAERFAELDPAEAESVRESLQRIRAKQGTYEDAKAVKPFASGDDAAAVDALIEKEARALGGGDFLDPIKKLIDELKKQKEEQTAKIKEATEKIDAQSKEETAALEKMTKAYEDHTRAFLDSLEKNTKRLNEVTADMNTKNGQGKNTP